VGQKEWQEVCTLRKRSSDSWPSRTDVICASFSWLVCCPREDSASANLSPLAGRVGAGWQSAREHVRLR